MNAEISISVQNLSKAYSIWSSPAARLHGPLLGRVGQLPFLPATAREFCKRRSHGAFRNFYALRDVSFEARTGQSIGIIGRNGSGKSTLLQILAGTLQPTSGGVTVNGSVAALLELGSGFDADFTGRENVYLNAAIRGLSRKQTDDKFDEIVAFADIGDFIDQPIKTYSSGMMVRLAFAVSACLESDVLIVDEALSVGDIFFQQKCIRHMQDRMQGVTKVLVTHDMQAVLSVTDYVYVLDRGEVAFSGNPGDAVEHFVKLAHSEAAERPTALVPPAPAIATSPPAYAGDLPWIDVKPQSRGGLGDVTIERVAVTRNDGSAAVIVRARDRLTVHLRLRAHKSMEHILVGYILVDRVGNWICGENTCSVAGGVFPLPAGDHLIEFAFDWPDIQPGEYTIMPGVGEGTEALRHVIQCWAHSVVKVSAVSTGKPIHCLFNNPLVDLKVSRVDAIGHELDKAS